MACYTQSTCSCESYCSSMGYSGTCYSNDPCSCNYNCTCNGQNLTCNAKRLYCSTRVYSWSFDPLAKDSMSRGITPIKASDLVELRANLVQEQKERSAHYTNKGSTINEGFEFDVPLVYTTDWNGVAAVGEKILASTYIQLKTLCNELTLKAGKPTPIVIDNVEQHAYIFGVLINQIMQAIDYSHMACICNSKTDCICHSYCSCNARCMNCPTNGCGYCTCHGQCSCLGNCGCNGACYVVY